jgi:hypothetical protein
VWGILCNICCKDFSNRRKYTIVHSITRARGLPYTFVPRVNLFENGVTRVSLFYFYTAVCTIDNVSLNVIRILACTGINMPLTCFQKGWNSYSVERYIYRCIHLSLRITVEVSFPSVHFNPVS